MEATLYRRASDDWQFGEVEAPAEFGTLAITAVHYGYSDMGRKFPDVCVSTWDRGSPVFAAVHDEAYIDPGPLIDGIGQLCRSHDSDHGVRGFKGTSDTPCVLLGTDTDNLFAHCNCLAH